MLLLGILIFSGITSMLGIYFLWDWDDFWSNFMSNAASSAVIGIVLYWLITRPDEKKTTEQRRAQALAMLKIEFAKNLERAEIYAKVLQSPEQDLTPYYPLRFTRGAWNALRESGFLPQLEDVKFVYDLLQVNEVITVANSSLMSVRRAKIGRNMKTKLKHYSLKATNECKQIEKHLRPILETLEKMNLPRVELATDIDDEEMDSDIIEPEVIANK